jgi:hypothetical protein
VEAKVEVKRINEDGKVWCDTYLFDFNPTIVSAVEKNLDVKPSDAKLTLGKIKGGAKTKTFTSTPMVTPVAEVQTQVKPTTMFKK